VVSLFAKATRRIGMTHIRYVTPVPMGAATGLVARVYHEVERDFGMLAPPLALHAPAPPALAATWLMLRETLLVPGLVGRDAKEAVAAAVSLANRCPYCVDVHGTTLAGLLRGADAAAVAADRIDTVGDPRLRALAGWARASGTPGGAAPAAAAELPELIGVAVTFHYINRMVNVFLCESPLPAVPAAALKGVRFAATRILSGLARLAPRPAQSLELLPDGPLPADLCWAGGQPHIAAAFARAGAAIDAGGTRAVPDRVRELVTARLDAATGTPGLASSQWLEPAVADLPAPERPAGRLALLTALGSYQVTDRLVDEYVADGHDDGALIELTSWASMAAARRIGRRLGEDATAGEGNA
jgi:AhpD family alkylhydroperoxidase